MRRFTEVILLVLAACTLFPTLCAFNMSVTGGYSLQGTDKTIPNLLVSQHHQAGDSVNCTIKDPTGNATTVPGFYCNDVNGICCVGTTKTQECCGSLLFFPTFWLICQLNISQILAADHNLMKLVAEMVIFSNFFFFFNLIVNLISPSYSTML